MSSLRTIMGALVWCGLVACAKAGDGDAGDGGGGYGTGGGYGAMGGKADTTSGGASTSDGGSGGDTSGTGGDTTTTSGSGGTGGDPGPICNPPQHLCGGICSDNTPATGCYQSVSCTPCPTVINGTAICSAQGACAPSCNSPYVPSGNNCVCPQQCCNDNDCSGGATCENGSCVDPCDEPLCIALCLIQGKVGICLANQCVCLG